MTPPAAETPPHRSPSRPEVTRFMLPRGTLPVTLYGYDPMAKRSTRRIVIDRVESAIRFLEQAEDRLANASQIYYENGAKEGALLDQINESLRILTKTVREFRYTRA